MAAKGFLLLPLFLISVIRYYRSKIQTKIYYPFCLVFCTFNRTFVSLKPKHKYMMFLSKRKEALRRIQYISLTFQVKISKISIIQPQWNKHITRQYLLFMSGTCTVDVRYMSGMKADMYRTSTGHIADNDRRCIGATRGLLYGQNGGMHEICQRVT